jgi:hypothetical protein
MRPEAKLAQTQFLEVFADVIDTMLAERDHWNVGGVEYGDRLMVLNALHNAINELPVLRVQIDLLDRGIPSRTPDDPEPPGRVA